MNITRGPVKTGIKVGIYGTEGVGKTTFAAKFPGAVFIDTEGSTKHMDVARFDPPESLNDVLEQLNYVAGCPDGIGTVVIDTVDWLEKFVFRAVCEEKKIQNIEDMGYGKGYVFAKQKMQGILELLDLISKRGIHVVLVCHSMIRKFELPDEMGSYDRYMLKLNEKNIAPLIKEWVDLLLFVNYRTDIVTDKDGKTKKGRGGQKRVMYANHSACWDAKNRFGLPDEMPFDYGQVAHLFGEAKPVEAATEPEEKIEPMEPVILPHLQKEKPAEVTTVSKVPSGKKKDQAPPERPEDMKSDNPEKDKLLEKLWNMMLKDDIPDSTVIRAVVAEKEYYDLAVPICDYETDFIEGCLIGAWDTVRGLAITKVKDLPF
jgi:hypothetical protein